MYLLRKYIAIVVILLSFWVNSFGENTDTHKNEDFSQFIPKGLVVNEKIYGDLNNDGIEDCVIIIKGTDKSKFVKDLYMGELQELDRNRRGIIILFNKNNSYELVLQNDTCFSSEFEDGGAYFAPELDLSIRKCKLYIAYRHGGYGYWEYTFRFYLIDFELIGYDGSSNRGSVVEKFISINYLTNSKIVKENTNQYAEGGDEIFKTTKTKIKRHKPIRLSKIKDFVGLIVPGE